MEKGVKTIYIISGNASIHLQFSGADQILHERNRRLHRTAAALNFSKFTSREQTDIGREGHGDDGFRDWKLLVMFADPSTAFSE
jgi:hypothetical protein